MLCSRGVQHVLRYERKPAIRFVAIKSDEGRALAAAHDVDAENPKTFLFIEGDVAHSYTDAILAMMKHLNGPSKYLGWLRFIPRPLRNFIYRRIANNRYAIFGKKEHCLLPQTEDAHRFTLN